MMKSQSEKGLGWSGEYNNFAIIFAKQKSYSMTQANNQDSLTYNIISKLYVS